jgi:hypothetical protein
MACNPTSWGAYRYLINQGFLEESTPLNRFAARYSMARQLTGVSFEGSSTATAEAYSAGLRVGLAYSALETLCGALRLGKTGISVRNQALAAYFRDPRQSKLQVYLTTGETGDDKKLIGEINTFLVNRSTDVRPIAARIRHLMFHGVFTAHGSSLATSATRRRAMEELAESVLEATDRRFTTWVEAQYE